MPPKRMTANPVAPQRYRAGKAPVEAPPSDDESGSESESDSDASPPPQTARPPPPKVASFPKLGANLAAQQAAAAKSRAAADAARRAADEEGFVTASDSSAESGEGSSEEESGSEEDSSDYDSDSSSDAGPRFAPPTIAKKALAKPAQTPDAPDPDVDRKAKADAMLQAQLDREAAERAAGRRDWDDDDGDAEEVDDTDGLDPAAEHAAWRLRELTRLKRARDALEAAEAEKAEIERREGLTQEERDKEDEIRLAAQKEEREGRGKMGFMQKYFHKGAFFQDDEGELAEVKRREVAGARFEDDVDRELLPQYMQIRDMTRLGRKGRTKYKDLRSEDTGTFGAPARRFEGGGQRERDREGPTGANEVAVGERRRREDEGGRDEKRARFDR